MDSIRHEDSTELLLEDAGQTFVARSNDNVTLVAAVGSASSTGSYSPTVLFRTLEDGFKLKWEDGSAMASLVSEAAPANYPPAAVAQGSTRADLLSTGSTSAEVRGGAYTSAVPL